MREYVRFIVLRYLLELAGLGGMEGLLVDANALMDAYEDRIRLVEQAEGLVEEIGDNEATMSQVQEELVKEILMGIIAVEVRIQEHDDEA
jgi:rRNA-processing protein FCF1